MTLVTRCFWRFTVPPAVTRWLPWTWTFFTVGRPLPETPEQVVVEKADAGIRRVLDRPRVAGSPVVHHPGSNGIGEALEIGRQRLAVAAIEDIHVGDRRPEAERPVDRRAWRSRIGRDQPEWIGGDEEEEGARDGEDRDTRTGEPADEPSGIWQPGGWPAMGGDL